MVILLVYIGGTWPFKPALTRPVLRLPSDCMIVSFMKKETPDVGLRLRPAFRRSGLGHVRAMAVGMLFLGQDGNRKRGADGRRRLEKAAPAGRLLHVPSSSASNAKTT
jgi:hypothetical protein